MNKVYCKPVVESDSDRDWSGVQIAVGVKTEN